MVLSVPNVSEGRDPRVIARLRDACAVPRVRVVDVHSDADHDRTVFTLVGPPMDVQDALVELAGACIDLIDLRRHDGVHPRVGALDVAPIVALTPDDEPLAEEVALGVADRIGNELMLPVFLYGNLVADPTRNRPHHFRTGGADALAEAIEEGRLRPDAGPERLHPTAGAVLVGVRPPLIAWNVELPDASLADARAIADRIRESGGGHPGLRAPGCRAGVHEPRGLPGHVAGAGAGRRPAAGRAVGGDGRLERAGGHDPPRRPPGHEPGGAGPRALHARAAAGGTLPRAAPPRTAHVPMTSETTPHGETP